MLNMLQVQYKYANIQNQGDIILSSWLMGELTTVKDGKQIM